MSTITWMKESYPIPADEVSEAGAIRHCLKKWKGAREENLARHGLRETPIEFNDVSCSLCQHHSIKRKTCVECPLYEYLGRRCYAVTDAGDFGLFQRYSYYGNPEPMIEALEAIAMVERICK